MEVLEALVRLEREADARVDVVPRRAQQAGEVDGMEGLDEHGIAHRAQNRGCAVCQVRIDRLPVDDRLDQPRTVLGCRGVLLICALRHQGLRHHATATAERGSSARIGQLRAFAPCATRYARSQRSTPNATHALAAPVPSCSLMSNASPKKRSWLLNDAAATVRPSPSGSNSSCFSPLMRWSSERPRVLGAKKGSVAVATRAAMPSLCASVSARPRPR